jgi:hypothetical protein
MYATATRRRAPPTAMPRNMGRPMPRMPVVFVETEEN